MAIIRKAYGKCLLVHRQDRPEVANVTTPRCKTDASIIEIAREFERMLKTGQSKGLRALSRQVGVTRPRIKQFLALLQLPREVQQYLVKSHDEKGKIEERGLRPLLKIGGKQDQIVAFKRLLSGLSTRGKGGEKKC